MAKFLVFNGQIFGKLVTNFLVFNGQIFGKQWPNFWSRQTMASIKKTMYKYKTPSLKMKSTIKLTGLALLATLTNAADGEVFSINTYKVQCDSSKQSYLDALESARNAYPAYIAALKGWKTATEIHAKDSTSQKFIDDYTGLGDWQNLLQRKHPKKNLRAWGAAENEFEFNLDDYAKVYEHSKGLYDTAKKTATSAKKTYLAACGSYEDIQQAYFNTLTTGEVGEDADGEDADDDGEDDAENKLTQDDIDAAVAGKCGGNAETATDLAEASDPSGTFQFECGDGFSLKASPATIALSGATDDEKKAVCCEADPVTGKCGGNAETATDLDEASGSGTFQFECGDGFSLKASPATIALSGATDDEKKAVCCEADPA